MSKRVLQKLSIFSYKNKMPKITPKEKIGSNDAVTTKSPKSAIVKAAKITKQQYFFENESQSDEVSIEEDTKPDQQLLDQLLMTVSEAKKTLEKVRIIKKIQTFF